MKILSKTDILSHRSLSPRTILIPEWGGEVKYKPMTMMERREIRQKCLVPAPDPETGKATMIMDNEKLELLAIIWCALDPTDTDLKKPLFAEDDIDILETQMAAGPLSALSQAILSASGLMTDAAKSGDKAKK